MEFEWDLNKSDATYIRRGFDSRFAAGIFAGSTVEIVDVRRDYREVRIRVTGETAGVVLVVICMAEFIRMTIERIGAAGGGRMDQARLAATTQADIRRHMIEDGENPDAPPPTYQRVPDVQAIRERLRMSQEAFASTIGVPVATVRNWEQRRTGIAPAARTLLRILEREPDAALRALAE